MATDDDQDILKAFEEDSDAFFDSLMSDAGLDAKPTASKAGTGAAPKSSPFDPPSRAKAAAAVPAAKAATPAVPAAKAATAVPAVKEDAAANIEPESDTLDSDGASTLPSSAEESHPSGGVAMFRMDDDSDGGEVEVDSGTAVHDCRPPEVPPPPADFTEEDLVLREVLLEFYLARRADNLANINSIVAKYRGPNTANLWAQLSIKYGLPAVEAVEMLSRTLYQSSPFEYENKELAIQLAETLAGLGVQGGSSDRAELFRRAIALGAKDGCDGVLRMLSFRGIPDDAGLRAQVWKVLLGYLPMKRHDEWNAIQGEKRALYASYKCDLIKVTDGEVCVDDKGVSAGSIMEAQDLLQEVKNDVDRTRRDFEYFRRPATKAALVSLLFVYARLNPGVRYVQGMNEVAAVILYVMSVDPECAEADAFWCFSELMAEIKDGFMQALDHTGEGVYGMVEHITALLRSYDPELARHLQKSELSLFVFVLRWCTVLFAQDATLPDVLRLWDSFIADPFRFEFVVHVCVAVILARRSELLETEKQFSLAEVVQSAPRCADFEQLLRRASAICAFERRGQQLPVFPPKRLQVVDDLSDWAQTAAVAASEAAAAASEVGLEVSRNIQENLAPVVLEKAGQASEVVQDKAQALQTWLQDTAPARQEAMEQAQTQLSSLWASVRTKGQQLASEAASSETVGSAASKFSVAAESASGWFARASMALAGNESPGQAGNQPRSAGAERRQQDPSS